MEEVNHFRKNWANFPKMLREEWKAAFVDPYLVSLIYPGRGDEQVTLQWLNRACVVRRRS
jgi:hypothetical protein